MREALTGLLKSATPSSHRKLAYCTVWRRSATKLTILDVLLTAESAEISTKLNVFCSEVRKKTLVRRFCVDRPQTETLGAKQMRMQSSFSQISSRTEIRMLEMLVSNETLNHFFVHFPASFAFETCFFELYGFELG